MQSLTHYQRQSKVSYQDDPVHETYIRFLQGGFPWIGDDHDPCSLDMWKVLRMQRQCYNPTPGRSTVHATLSVAERLS